ncbi:MAG: class I SAM-dependent methyltransferase [Sphingomonadaceae bacterium]
MNEQADDIAGIFRRLIRNTGPVSLSQYMGESNARYYNGRDPLGGAGDFVTAPEISQMFGELIGLWLADIWIRAGRQEPVHYVELGPGRGTLARDALRSAAQYGLTPAVHFVETSSVLREIQLATVPGAFWHNDLSTVPHDGVLLLVANEFLDALPVRQLVATEQGWRERMIGLEEGRFVPVAGQQPMDSAIPEEWKQAPPGTILETCPGASALMFELCGRLDMQDGAALLIDYGYTAKKSGSTLQAVRAHEKVDPFAYPGEADLTALVDFEILARIAESRDVSWLGTVSQGQWLRALGIEARAEALCARAPQYRQEIQEASDRLTSDDQMGQLFKVMGLTCAHWPEGAGFELPE